MKKWLSIAFLAVALCMLTVPVYADTSLAASSDEQTAEAAVKYLTVVYGAYCKWGCRLLASHRKSVLFWV